MTCSHTHLKQEQPYSVFFDGWAVRDGDGWRTFPLPQRPDGVQAAVVLVCQECKEAFQVVVAHARPRDPNRGA